LPPSSVFLLQLAAPAHRSFGYASQSAASLRDEKHLDSHIKASYLIGSYVLKTLITHLNTMAILCKFLCSYNSLWSGLVDAFRTIDWLNIQQELQILQHSAPTLV